MCGDGHNIHIIWFAGVILFWRFVQFSCDLIKSSVLSLKLAKNEKLRSFIRASGNKPTLYESEGKHSS